MDMPSITNSNPTSSQETSFNNEINQSLETTTTTTIETSSKQNKTSTTPSISIQNTLSKLPQDSNDIDTHLNSPLSPQEENDRQRILLKERNLDEIKQQCSTLISELEGNQHPEIVIKKHIQQLKKYNELKDIALELISMIADQRQVRTTDILNEMKVELGEDSI